MVARWQTHRGRAILDHRRAAHRGARHVGRDSRSRHREPVHFRESVIHPGRPTSGVGDQSKRADAARDRAHRANRCADRHDALARGARGGSHGKQREYRRVRAECVTGWEIRGGADASCGRESRSRGAVGYDGADGCWWRGARTTTGAPDANYCRLSAISRCAPAAAALLASGDRRGTTRSFHVWHFLKQRRHSRATCVGRERADQLAAARMGRVGRVSLRRTRRAGVRSVAVAGLGCDLHGRRQAEQTSRHNRAPSQICNHVVDVQSSASAQRRCGDGGCAVRVA